MTGRHAELIARLNCLATCRYYVAGTISANAIFKYEEGWELESECEHCDGEYALLKSISEEIQHCYDQCVEVPITRSRE